MVWTYLIAIVDLARPSSCTSYHGGPLCKQRKKYSDDCCFKKQSQERLCHLRSQIIQTRYPQTLMIKVSRAVSRLHGLNSSAQVQGPRTTYRCVPPARKVGVNYLCWTDAEWRWRSEPMEYHQDIWEMIQDPQRLQNKSYDVPVGEKLTLKHPLVLHPQQRMDIAW